MAIEMGEKQVIESGSQKKYFNEREVIIVMSTSEK